MEKYYNSVVKIFNKGVNFNYGDPLNNYDNFASTGTGFFIKINELDKNNIYIITAAHVVENYDTIQISIPKYGEKLFDVELFLACNDYDIAYLKIDIEKNDLQEIIDNISYTLGDSDELSIGDAVNTLGFPQDALNLLYTSGHISGIRDKYIQTDTPLNPGNSGGPLFFNDKIVGVNSAIISKSNNASLVIPINLFHIVNSYIIQNIKDGKKINKLYNMPTMGITYQALSGICSEDSQCPQGVFINRVIKNSNAYKAGIRVGYVLYKIDNYEIDRKGNTELPWFKYGKLKLENIIRRKKPYEEISCFVYDFPNKKHIKHPIKFMLNDSSLCPLRNYFYPEEQPDYEIFGGMILMDLCVDHILKEEDEEYEFNPLIYHINKYGVTRGGLYISKIFPNSHLLDYDSIKKNMLILSINGYSVKNTKDFRYIVTKLISKGIKELLLLTDRNIVVNININEILEKEPLYREKYNYKKSKFYDTIESLINN